MQNYLSRFRVKQILLFLSIFLLSSLGHEEVDNKQLVPVNKAGIVLTFDDNAVSAWLMADSILKKHRWKATFCITKINRLTVNEMRKLHALQDAGHEIAGHGLNHADAVKHIKNYNITSYLQKEIIPMNEILQKESFVVNSFAYPNGNGSKKCDRILLKYFKILRGTTYGEKTPAKHNCFFNNSPVVYGIGIDSNYEHYSDEYLIDLLSYAKINGKILIVYGHKPVYDITGDYQVKISTLELICRYIEENNMKYYTLSDLAKELK